MVTFNFEIIELLLVMKAQKPKIKHKPLLMKCFCIIFIRL